MTKVINYNTFVIPLLLLSLFQRFRLTAKFNLSYML